MPEVVIPAGITISALVISALGWYGMLRTGVQFVHDDLHARRSYGEDIVLMSSDVAAFEDKMRQWKKKWHISEHTDNACLVLLWGESNTSNIIIQWKAIEMLLSHVRTKLRGFMSNEKRRTIRKKKKKHFMELSPTEWNEWPVEKKRKKVKYIWTQKTFLQSQMARFPQILANLDTFADGGWLRQQSLMFGKLNRSNPYHVQKIYNLKRIAKELGKDFDQLRECLQDLQDTIIELDLDIFDALSARSTDEESARVAALAATNHLKLGLLFKKKAVVNRNLNRALVEKASDPPHDHGSPENAFEAVLASQASTCFLSMRTTFRLSKSPQRSNPSAPRETLKDRFSKIPPPFYTSQRNELQPPGLALGAFSTFRLCHELGQACVLLLRTELFAGICGCQLQFGSFPYTRNDSSRIWYEYSMSLVFDPRKRHSHQRPRWKNPQSLEDGGLEGGETDSWCQCPAMSWDNFMQPIRRLGLLFLEIILATSVVGVSVQHTKISSVTIITLSHPQPNRHDGRFVRKTMLSVEKVVTLAGKAIRKAGADLDKADSLSVQKAIETCLTCVYPAAPTDKQGEQALDDIYLDVVQPMRDIYTKLLEEQPFRRAYANSD